jgi:toxin ParE1/3/4
VKSFSLTRIAKVDLRGIAIFTEERWGVEQRNLYIKQFDDAFQMLAASPLLGKRCDDILPDYRKFPQGSHLIFYKDGSDSIIEIIRILHKSMDVETQMREPTP